MKNNNANKIIESFQNKYKKNREIINYLICGFLTFVVSMVVYALFSEMLKINVLVSNIITWIIAVFFAFVINRKYVFRSNRTVLSELMQFYFGRIATLVVEQIMLYILIIRLSFDNLTIKLIAQVVIIILNYLISKFIVFKRRDNC